MVGCDMTFSGKKLRDMRGEMPRPILAEKVGCSIKTLFNWESGRTLPSANDLATLCDSLNTTFIFFYETEPPCPESSETPNGK